jgi:hypothetical protein
MYTILINDENELYGSHKERIMHRSNCIDTLVFIVDPIYKNTHDMTKASVMLEYLLPVSKRYMTEILELSDERYNDCFLQYKLPFTTKLTSEAGKVELQLTFAYVEMDANGITTQRVRKTSTTTIDIIPITAWSDIIPDSALSTLDQRIVMMNAQMQAINDYMNASNNKVDNLNLVYDDVEETLQLSANGEVVGNKVSVRDMLDDGIPVIDLNGSDSDNDSALDDNNCNHDCGCKHDDKDIDVIVF